MSEHPLMKDFRASYNVVDIKKIQGEIRLLNAHLFDSLNVLNCVLNKKKKLQVENKRLKEDKDILSYELKITNAKLEQVLKRINERD